MPAKTTLSHRPRVAVVTGAHPFRERPFDAMLRAWRRVDARRVSLEAFLTDPSVQSADAVLFYHFHQEGPDPAAREVLGSLWERGAGIVVLHHALLAWPEWPLWNALVGLSHRDFSYHPAQRIRVEIVDPDHPITADLEPWEMTDETYRMDEPDDCHPIFRVDHPQSMRTVGWVRRFGNSRVFCFQCGHDNRVYDHPHYRQALENGLLWTVGLLD